MRAGLGVEAVFGGTILRVAHEERARKHAATKTIFKGTEFMLTSLQARKQGV